VDDGVGKALEGRFSRLETLVTAIAEVVDIILNIWEKEWSIEKPNKRKKDMKGSKNSMGRLAVS
jgi:hypothetical protein